MACLMKILNIDSGKPAYIDPDFVSAIEINDDNLTHPNICVANGYIHTDIDLEDARKMIESGRLIPND